MLLEIINYIYDKVNKESNKIKKKRRFKKIIKQL